MSQQCRKLNVLNVTNKKTNITFKTFTVALHIVASSCFTLNVAIVTQKQLSMKYNIKPIRKSKTF